MVEPTAKRRKTFLSRPKTAGEVGQEQNSGGSRTTYPSSAGRNPTANGDFFLGQSDMEFSSFDLMQMQVAELLHEVLPNFESRVRRIDGVLRKVKSIIEELPALYPVPLEEGIRTIRRECPGITVPIPHPRPSKETEFNVVYLKPASINIVGGVSLRTSLKDQHPMTVDMAVIMPATIFNDKDHLDYQYFHKRAFYLARIASGLVASRGVSLDAKFDWQSGNTLQPVLLLFAKGAIREDSLPKNSQIRVLLGPPKGYFPLNKLLPWTVCVRAPVMSSNTTPCFEENKYQRISLYNGSLQSEALHESYHKFLHTASVEHPGFRTAVVLMSVWLRQRGLGTELQRGGFGAFEAAAITAFLLQGGGAGKTLVLPRGYDGYQLFKAILNFIASTDLIQHPVMIGPVLKVAVEPQFRQPLFFDTIRMHNLLFKMTANSFHKLQRESQVSLDSLSQLSGRSFDACFIKKAENLRQASDYIVQTQLPQQLMDIRTGMSWSSEILTFVSEICYVISRALGDRLVLLHPQLSSSQSWPVKSEPPDPTQGTLSLGLLVNPEKIDRSVDRGPPADDLAIATNFREFWGDKAELRRFKDGEIQESLVWDNRSNQPGILRQILTYIINRHFGNQVASTLKLIGDESVDNIYLPSHMFLRDEHSAERSCRDFEKLREDIQTLQSLPLQVRQLSLSSPLASGVSIDSSPSQSTNLCGPIDVVIQFESSARWPDDLEAIQRTKAAILMKLDELLSSFGSVYSCVLGLENESTHLLNNTYLDVRTESRIFRIRIYHDRELFLLERQLKVKGISSYDQVQVANAIAAYTRTFVQSPKHTQIVRSLCTRFHSLAPSIRLFKLWCSAHLVAPHLAPELLELLVIQTFTSPYPFSAPGNAQTAFLRTLAFIAGWDWRREPLIVETNEPLDSSEYELIQGNFKAWRKADPAMNRVAIFVGSRSDPGGTTWTREKPIKVAATRLTALARAAISRFKEFDSNTGLDTLFNANFEDYDFIIHMNKKMYKPETPDENGFKNLTSNISDPWVSHDVDLSKHFLSEIEKCFGSYMFLFHDGITRSTVAGLWNIQLGSRPWKFSLPYSTVPKAKVEEEMPEALPNKGAILSDISRLGGDCIAKIELINGLEMV